MTTAEIDRLSPQERLDLIGALWDSLSPEQVRLTPAQEAELERRMATFDVASHQTRRAALRQFPYLLIFREVDDAAHFVAVFHTSRNPRIWQRR